MSKLCPLADGEVADIPKRSTPKNSFSVHELGGFFCRCYQTGAQPLRSSLFVEWRYMAFHMKHSMAAWRFVYDMECTGVLQALVATYAINGEAWFRPGDIAQRDPDRISEVVLQTALAIALVVVISLNM